MKVVTLNVVFPIFWCNLFVVPKIEMFSMYHHTIWDDKKKTLPLVAAHSEALLLQHVFPRKNWRKKNTQGKKDSVTKLNEVRWDILCTTVWNRHCQRNGWTPVWYFDTRRPLSGPQIYGPTECSWRKDSVMGILDVSTARWSSDNEVLITTPVNGMKRSPLSLRTYKSTTNKRQLPQKGEKKKGGKKREPKEASTDPTRTSGWR